MSLATCYLPFVICLAFWHFFSCGATQYTTLCICLFICTPFLLWPTDTANNEAFYVLWWEPWLREDCTVCAVHVYTLITLTVPTTHLEIKLAWVSALQSWAYNNQRKYRIIGTSIDFVNLRLIMNRVGILARASTSNEIFQTKILAWVSTLQSSTQHKNKLR